MELHNNKINVSPELTNQVLPISILPVSRDYMVIQISSVQVKSRFKSELHSNKNLKTMYKTV